MAPFINSLTIAFVIRALSVASVNRSRLCLYSPDDSVKGHYRNLSYIANRVKEPMSKVHPLTHVSRSGRIIHCATLKEFSQVEKGVPMILIIDARYTRGWTKLDPAPWKDMTGPKVFLAAWDDERLKSLVPEGGIVYCNSCGKGADEWPDSLRSTRVKLDNFSRGISLIAEPMPGSSERLSALERAYRALSDKTRNLDQMQAHLAQARRLNHFVQDSILPLSLYGEAAGGMGQYWIQGMLSSVKSGLTYEIPAVTRAAFYNFAQAASSALKELELHHPPKVAWFKKLLLERKRRVYVYCGTHIEQLAFENWSKSGFSEGCAETVVITPRQVRSDGFDSDIIVPGPPSQDDLAYFLGGASTNVCVLVYAWQAKHWNLVTNRVSNIISGIRPLPEPIQPEAEAESEDRVAWTVPERSDGDGEQVLVREFAGQASARTVLIKTDAGMLEYEEGALVPTLEVDKFVDRQATLLRKGDTVILRTDGNLIDSRRTVDELATTNPLLAEAAEEASTWRKVLGTYVRAQQMSYKQIHVKLFPNNEVTYITVGNWVMGRIKVGPQNDNLALLMRRIGISEQKVREMLRSIHVYRSYRARVYKYLFRLWNNYAGRIYELDEEKANAEDEKIDAEFGLSLSALEHLLTFAKITEPPILQEAHRKNE